MALTRYDLAVLLYHMAVVLSGVWILENFQLHGTGALYAIAVVLGLFWTIYFRWGFVYRLPCEYGGRAANEEKSN